MTFTLQYRMHKKENTDPKEQVPLLYYILGELEQSGPVKPLNKNAIRMVKTVFETPGITRKELSAKLQIRPGTVTKLTAKLVTDKILLEKKNEPVTERGRPEIPLFINGNKWTAIAVSCDSRQINAALINCADTILLSRSIEIPSDIESDDFETRLCAVIRDLSDSSVQPHDSCLLGVSISIPGIVDSEKKELIFTPRWSRIRHFSFKTLEKKTGIPLSIHRQLDVQLTYELAIHPQYKKGNVLLFHWGYGIGGAFASHGNIITSKSGVFCQIGHIPVHSDATKTCLCGRTGCLETEAAYWALRTDIESSFGYLDYKNEVSAAAYFKEKEFETLPFFQTAADSIAVAISNLQAILVPDVILLYGIFCENVAVQKSLIEKVKSKTSSYLLEQTAFSYITASHSWNAQAVTYSHFLNTIKSYFNQPFTLL